MRIPIGPGTIIVVLFLLIVWFFRHEYITRELDGAACVERINRYTRDRCLVTDDIPRCLKVIKAKPCEG